MEKTSQTLLETVVKAGDDKRAEDIMALDVQEISLLADYFVIMHGNNDRQVEAIAESVIDAAEKTGYTVKNVEGKNSAKWVLVDLGDIIVHVFNHSERSFYNLEKLWSDAPLVNLSKWVTK
ncbi:MAG: ribosome silencing factor [Pisciglobus halotolerans]|nr:ribosome silencing factor [Pisciglobus halotolerans]